MVSHSQYLCPDYLSPMPTSLETGKSPLALLEKTCSSIGLSDVPTKGKSSSSSSQKSPIVAASPESFTTKTLLNQKPVKSPEEKRKSSPVAEPNSPKTKYRRLESPIEQKVDSTSGLSPVVDENCNKKHKSENDHKSVTRTGATITSESRVSPAGSNISQAVPPTIPSLPSTSRYLNNIPSSLAAYGIPGFTMENSFPHGFSFPLAASYAAAAGMPGQAPGVPRICLDPNCKGCSSSVIAGLGPRGCPPGCTQCVNHSSADAWLNSYNSLMQSLSAVPQNLMAPFLHAPANPAQPSNQGMQAALQNLACQNAASAPGNTPFCSWVTPEGVCLKRFATSEELLQHVRTHTNQESSPRAVNPLLNMPSPLLRPPAPVNGRISPRSAYLNALRYHQYQKLSSPTSVNPVINSALPHLPFGSPFGNYSAALNALYAGQRVPGSLPHP